MSAVKMTVREVLDRLRPGNAGIPEAAAEDRDLSAGENRTPWFVKAMVAVSAWIAAVMLLVFVLGARIVSSSGGSIVLGALICAGAVLLRKSQGKNFFLVQLALALSLAGQALLIGGIGDKMGDEGGAFAAVLLSIALIIFYPDGTHRFISTLIAVGGAAYFVLEVRLPYGLQVLAAGLAAGGGHLWYRESLLLSGEKEALMKPVAYGLIMGSLFLLAPSMFSGHLPEFRRAGLALNWAPATIALTALLMVLEYRLLAFHQSLDQRKLGVYVFGGTLAVAAASLKAPGIMAALFVLATGFHRGNRIIMGFALAFMAVFLSAYYYNMEITLLAKSYALAASGAILLLLRLFVTGALTQSKS